MLYKNEVFNIEHEYKMLENIKKSDKKLFKKIDSNHEIAKEHIDIIDNNNN